jgi:hypothetical protein
MSWDRALARIAAGEPALDVLEGQAIVDREGFRAFLADMGPRGVAALAGYDKAIRDIDLGISGARGTWRALSISQRRVLWEIERRGPRLERVGKEYRAIQGRHQPYVPIHVRSIRPLCQRELLAWDGGAFDPEAAVVLTERGQFIIKHGQTQ